MIHSSALRKAKKTTQQRHVTSTKILSTISFSSTNKPTRNNSKTYSQSDGRLSIISTGETRMVDKSLQGVMVQLPMSCLVIIAQASWFISRTCPVSSLNMPLSRASRGRRATRRVGPDGRYFRKDLMGKCPRNRRRTNCCSITGHLLRMGMRLRYTYLCFNSFFISYSQLIFSGSII